ncbi:MAG: bifunctional hydroxymethylpyrimidine kinase/phosphomethylpyrimidine kinase [Actinomycetota bacterium]|nr:bifunctional hydroxymethylpyrimidine kinase/phosphomethylpyrimidine kinase [Actinomycetota bacterium]
MDVKKVLVIGGSDPSGGAGIQADVKTLVEIGVYPYSAITAITVQNSSGLTGYEVVPARLLREQINAVIYEGNIRSIKTGMLGSSENILEIASLLTLKIIEYSVIDPVIKASNRVPLLSDASIAVLKKRLLPYCFMVTPNADEAKCLTGLAIKTEKDLLDAAMALKETGVKWVLVKGGHLESNLSIDLLYDGEREYYFESEKVGHKNVRGTGCMLASAITAYLTLGFTPCDAVDKAKAYVFNKICNAVQLGKGSLQALHFRKEGGCTENRID